MTTSTGEAWEKCRAIPRSQRGESNTAVQSRRIARARHFCDIAESDDSDMVYEPVSVVVYSQDEAEALDKLLRDILTQDYPADMEVIVVNEGESSDVRDVVDMLKNEYPGLYLTNTPDGARNLSRKKLALTLGVKAARHSVVVHTAIVSLSSDSAMSQKCRARAILRLCTAVYTTATATAAAVNTSKAETGRRNRAVLSSERSKRPAKSRKTAREADRDGSLYVACKFNKSLI